MNLTISVIVVVKNGAAYLLSAIGSIWAQTVRPNEIIIVVGQSDDDTLQIANSLPAVTVVAQQSTGLANARNCGIDHATGNLIAFLDHDDLWHPLKLEKQLPIFIDSPTIQYCTTHFSFLGGPRNTQSSAAGTPGTLIARAALFDQIGRFDPRYQIGCDADWFTRARDHQIKSAIVPEILFYKRLHTSNLSNKGSRNRQELFDIARRSIKRVRQTS